MVAVFPPTISTLLHSGQMSRFRNILAVVITFVLIVLIAVSVPVAICTHCVPIFIMCQNIFTLIIPLPLNSIYLYLER